MFLLQAAIAGKIVLIILFGLFLLIGIPILTSVLMKLYWTITGKKDNIKNGKAYYKDFIPFLSILIFSTVALILLFYLLIILFDKAFPSFGYSN